MSEDDIDHAMDIMELKHDAENDLQAKVERLEKAIESALEALDIGDCEDNTCRGCRYDVKVAISDLKAALAATPPAAEETLTCICATNSDLTCPAHPQQPETVCLCLRGLQCNECREHNFGRHDTYHPKGPEDYFSHCLQCAYQGCKDGKIQVTEGAS